MQVGLSRHGETGQGGKFENGEDRCFCMQGMSVPFWSKAQTKIKEQRAKKKEQRTKSKEQRAKNKE